MQGAPPPAAATPATTDPVEFMEWQDDNDKVLAPRAGGLMLVDGEPMAYTGSDPDSKSNIYSYVVDKADKTKGSWKCPKETHDPTHKSHKGPLHVGQFRPTNVKEKCKVKTSCCTFARTAKYVCTNKLNVNSNNIPLWDYVRTARKHMIENGMWSVFQYIDPISNKRINLFDSLGEIKFYELKKNLLTANFLRSILLKVDLEASGPEMLEAIFESMHYMDV
eukprot:11727087-Ditylum_brightwellii.AAC.1